jgi:hypothetical protein
MAVKRAARLARGPRETYRVKILEVLIERDAGNHAAALKAARALVALSPQDKTVLRLLSEDPWPQSPRRLARGKRSSTGQGRSVRGSSSP